MSAKRQPAEPGAWVDPDPIRLPTVHGLVCLLYRRRPVEQPREFAVPGEPSAVMGQPLPYDDPDWLAYVEEDQQQDRQARQDVVESQPRASRPSPSPSDPTAPGAA